MDISHIALLPGSHLPSGGEGFFEDFDCSLDIEFAVGSSRLIKFLSGFFTRFDMRRAFLCEVAWKTQNSEGEISVGSKNFTDLIIDLNSPCSVIHSFR